MVRTLKNFILGIAAILGCAAVGLTEPRLSVEVHPNFGTIDDIFIFSANIEDGQENSGPPLLTGGADFDLSLLGPATSVQIINGTIRRRNTYNYQLSPKREGILDTPSAEITIEGKKLTAQPLQVTVKGMRTASAPADAEEGNQSYFMRQSVSPDGRVYVGQQITHTLEIFTRTTLMDPQLQNLTFAGFRTEAIGEQENGKRYLNGVPYAVSILHRALFPEAPGVVEIAPRALKARVRAGGSSGGFPFDFDTTDPFDPNFIDSFFNRGVLRSITLRSNPLTVRVEPLPAIPAEMPLLGLDTLPVGQTVVRAKYDGSEITFGETKTVSVIISSTGNIQGIKSIGLKSSPALKVYEESPQTKSAPQGDLLWTTKTFKVSLVPLEGSTVELPPISLGYFDPTKGRYEIASAPPIAFAVKGAPAQSQPSAAPTEGTAVSPSEAAPQATKRTHALRYEEPSAVEALAAKVSVPLALLVLCCVLAIAAAVALGLRLRARGAPRRANESALVNAQGAEAIAAVLRTALSQSYPGLPEQFSREELRKRVTNKQLLYQIESLLDTLDSTLFGGAQGSLPELKEQAKELLRAL